MGNDESMAEAMAEMAQSVLATPNHRRRLKSGTFWERLGCKRRTPERIKEVCELLEHHCVSVSLRARHSMDELLDVAFGNEDRADWVVLTHQGPASMQSVSPEATTQPDIVTTPLDSWFQDVIQLSFRSEADVVYKFIGPLFEHLGYEEPDIAYEHPVEMYFGREKFKDKEADVVLFMRDDHVNDTHKHENTLIVAEAKKLGKPIDADVEGQARSYAMWLSPVYYVVTNGEDVKVFLYQMTAAEDILVMPPIKRADLKQRWPELFKLLCKKRVLEVKEKRRQILLSLQSLV